MKIFWCIYIGVSLFMVGYKYSEEYYRSKNKWLPFWQRCLWFVWEFVIIAALIIPKILWDDCIIPLVARIMQYRKNRWPTD